MVGDRWQLPHRVRPRVARSTSSRSRPVSATGRSAAASGSFADSQRTLRALGSRPSALNLGDHTNRSRRGRARCHSSRFSSATAPSQEVSLDDRAGSTSTGSCSAPGPHSTERQPAQSSRNVEWRAASGAGAASWGRDRPLRGRARSSPQNFARYPSMRIARCPAARGATHRLVEPPRRSRRDQRPHSPLASGAGTNAVAGATGHPDRELPFSQTIQESIYERPLPNA